MAVDHEARSAGIHHVPADGTPDQALRLATELGAPCCTTPAEVDAWMAALTVTPTPTEVARLSDRVTAAHRILDRTRRRAIDDARAVLAPPGSGLAIHPSTVRERAAALVRARAAHATAEAELHDQEDLVGDGPPAEEEGPAVPDPTAVPPPPRRRWWARLRRWRRPAPHGAHDEAMALLQQVAASTDEVFGARRALVARDDLLAVRRARRDRALEELRVAERAWQELAGDTPVEEVDEVVRRHDPQLEEATARADLTPGVRAVQAMLADAEHQLSEVEGASARPSVTVVLVAEAASRAADVTTAAPAAVVLVVS